MFKSVLALSLLVVSAIGHAQIGIDWSGLEADARSMERANRRRQQQRNSQKQQALKLYRQNGVSLRHLDFPGETFSLYKTAEIFFSKEKKLFIRSPFDTFNLDEGKQFCSERGARLASIDEAIALSRFASKTRGLEYKVISNMERLKSWIEPNAQGHDAFEVSNLDSYNRRKYTLSSKTFNFAQFMENQRRFYGEPEPFHGHDVRAIWPLCVKEQDQIDWVMEI